MAASAADPTLWKDEFDDTPPINFEAVELDDRFWFSSFLGIQGQVIYIGPDPLPALLELEVEVTDAPEAPFNNTVFNYFLDGVLEGSVDCGIGLGTTQVNIDTTSFPEGAVFSFIVNSWNTGSGGEGNGMYDGVAAVLGPDVPAEEEEEDPCLACFDVGALCTSPLSDLLSDVIAEVEKCSDPQAETAIRDTVIDFLKRSKILSFDHPAISLVAATADYELRNPCGFQILHVRSGSISGKPFRLTSEEQLDLNWEELSRGWSWRYQFSEAAGSPADDWRTAESAEPALGFQLNPNHLRIVGIPTEAAADALTLKVVVFPTRAVTTLPKWIFNTWDQAIVSGAIGRLKMMVGKPFTDREAGLGYMATYEQGVLDAESSGLRGYKRNDQPVRRTRSWSK